MGDRHTDYIFPSLQRASLGVVFRERIIINQDYLADHLRVYGVVFIVVGLAFAMGATEYRFGTSARPGPGYFPLGLGLLLATVVVLLALAWLYRWRKGRRG